MIKLKTKKIAQLFFRGGLVSLLFSSHNQALSSADYLLNAEDEVK